MATNILESVAQSLGSFLSAAAQTFVSPFITIWDWLLFNVLTPALLIGFLVGFFIGQYYLLRLYLYLARSFFIGLSDIYDRIRKTRLYKQFLSVFDEIWD